MNSFYVLITSLEEVEKEISDQENMSKYPLKFKIEKFGMGEQDIRNCDNTPIGIIYLYREYQKEKNREKSH